MVTYFHDISNKDDKLQYIKIFKNTDGYDKVLLCIALGGGRTLSAIPKGIELIDRLEQQELDYHYMNHTEFMELTK